MAQPGAILRLEAGVEIPETGVFYRVLAPVSVCGWVLPRFARKWGRLVRTGAIGRALIRSKTVMNPEPGRSITGNFLRLRP